DVLTRAEAIEILKRAEAGKAERISILEKEGYACYTTSAGWLGYGDEPPDGLAGLLGEQIPDGIDDRARRQVDGALFRADPAQLAI
ncbi:hypothetical protein ACC706_37180, partial [Rhizobium johnstonii]